MNGPAIRGVAVTAAPCPAAGAVLLAPLGIASAIGSCCGMTVSGGRIAETAGEIETGQMAAVIVPDAPAAPVTLTYRFATPDAAPRYPEAAFQPRLNRYTRAADALVEASRTIAEAAGGGHGAIQALVDEARARFTYDHPRTRFNDGHDAVPFLGCGVTPGSCVDINTYLVASLRAAGFEAAYVYGYFFPAEKGGTTVDMHCWVATRLDGDVLDWDIAHHIKAGLDPVRPALNPRPGRRVVLGHSMGHRYDLRDGRLDLKLLSEPQWLVGGAASPKVPAGGVRIVGPS